MRFLVSKSVLVLFGTSALFGQVQEDVKKVLVTKDFAAFKEFAHPWILMGIP